ncbi:MAG: hypothetical protein IT377_00960 [Polyangiaceae bacterium]|nr:hypothetical protein [Polyangiaceae bacterium]
MTRIALFAAAALVPVLAPAAAGAQAVSADVALAETLFREGKELASLGRFGDACPKLADSQRLDPGGGTVLALAHCYEAWGRLASAWAMFNDAVAFAQRDARADREDEARRRIAALEPRLSWVELEIRAPAPGQSVSRDGVALPASAWAVRMPLDPGEHAFESSAPGRVAWRRTVSVIEEGTTQKLEIPELAAAPKPPPSPPPAHPLPAPARRAPPAVERPSSTRRFVGYSALGLGVASVGVGSYFGLRAISNARAADDACPAADCTDPRAVEKSEDALRFATVSTVTVIGGLALTAAGAYLLLVDADATRPGVAVRPGGVAVFGRF